MRVALPKWAKVLDYIVLARLHRPIGIWLLLFPCWWGLSLAGLKITTHPWLFFVLFVGSVALRSAGCVFNDLLDRHVDRLIERTKNRPLATGVVSPYQGILFFGILCLPGLWVLAQLPVRCLLWAPVSFFLLLIYPLAKRFTHWPQAVLGMSYSMGIIFGFTAIKPLEPVTLIFYLANILWTIAFDTIYAMQDRDDDEIVGVKSTAVMFGALVRPIVTTFYVGTVGLILLAGYMNGAQVPFYIILTVTLALTIWQLITWNPNDKNNCSKAFKANQWFGLLVFVALQTGL